ncbi:hypothetical protein VB834_12150 [Limnoraphis robusta Tam1]|uniref:hypothetical protein n=1 Tax=Limnoraphis robusta TaxID=1118279 RepID=UPI002B21B568|nr:hypothetical protein [Limnoraphis robusta]MEA5496506.1 hypothetical protein [Limnoraphis robusta BA-68 BA1]MEA5539783.1 hypothetical protein [Limnoraphis robusta Tam1]
MPEFKEYRSVSEFPAKAENLTYEELIANYYDLRNTYRSLTSSRGQLVRRQREAKEKIVVLNQDIREKIKQLETLEQEKQEIERILERRNFELQQKDIQKQELKQELNTITAEIIYLKEERQAISNMIQNLKNTYDDVQGTNGILGTFERLQNIMRAVKIFFTTDIGELIKQQKAEINSNPDSQENSRTIGKNLLDKK